MNNTNNDTNSNNPNSIISNKSIKTFEQLLNESSSNPASPITDRNSDEVLSQIDKLKTDLGKSRLQLEHLNELLNESELNNNRLSEQINLLKEEIRR